MIRGEFKSNIVQTIIAVLIPFVQLFALYVVIHGHYGPGGGFQGGVLLAISIIMQRFSIGREASYKRFKPETAVVFAAVGLLVFVFSGLLPVLLGGSFLDYGYLPISWVHGPELRSLGILIVEIGIALGVFGTMVAVFDTLSGKEW